MSTINDRETGARSPIEKKGPSVEDAFSQDAAGNTAPPSGKGNSLAPGQAPDQDDPTSKDTQKAVGAGPALKEHSKDAQRDA